MNDHLQDWHDNAIDGNDYNNAGGGHDDIVSRASDDEEDDIDMKHNDDTPNEWGAPWIQCVPKHFAVQEGTYNEGASKGISVYKILAISKDTVDDNGQVLRTFTGREYTCTKLNTTRQCVTKGKWYFHNSLSQSAVHEIYHYDVISYFEKLEDGMLPDAVVDDINLVEEKKTLFDS